MLVPTREGHGDQEPALKGDPGISRKTGFLHVT